MATTAGPWIDAIDPVGQSSAAAATLTDVLTVGRLVEAVHRRTGMLKLAPKVVLVGSPALTSGVAMERDTHFGGRRLGV